MNRTQGIGLIIVILWFSGAIIFFHDFQKLLEVMVFTLTGFFNSVIILDFPNIFKFFSTFFICVIIFLPLYMSGLVGIFLLWFGEE